MQLITSSTTCHNTQALALARKYASQGPRYTSYPTAPQFSGSFPLGDYYRWQSDTSSNKREALSLYVHLPFCDDICYYCGCNKIVTRKPGVAREYLDRLKAEIEAQAALVGTQRPITQMHWGGGTPTFLDDAEITELMHLLASHFKLLDKGYREYSIEIDPRTIGTETVALLKGVGFNRISLGIQDFDPLVQKAINRIQPLGMVAPLVETIRRHGFRSLSFDLIYGLPHQDVDSVTETLKKVIQLRPDRIACYNYAHMPERFSSQRAIDRLSLPEPEDKLVLHELIAETLQEAGYLHIGMDHFVFPEDDLAKAQQDGRLQRNFQGYSVHMADDLLGLGASAISQIGDFYLQNARDVDDYYNFLDKGDLPIVRGFRVSAEDKLRRHVIMSLISDLKLDIADCEQQFGINFFDRFNRELTQLRPLQSDGLLTIDRQQITIHEPGRAFLRNICMPFDAYLPKVAAGDKPQFSATV